KIVDNNYIRYINILKKDPATPTQKIQWIVKIKQSSHSINEERKRRRDGSDVTRSYCIRTEQRHGVGSRKEIV
ncbi:28722_t:CDS:2, partial [Racocetra persica]